MSNKYRSLAKSQKSVLETPFLEQVGEQPIQVVIENQMEAIMFRFGNDIVEDIRQSLEDKEFNTSGQLYASIKPFSSQSANNFYKLEVKMADHWEAAETGRPKGGMPPIENIMEWITQRGIKVRTSRSQSRQSVLQKKRSMAWAIAKGGEAKDGSGIVGIAKRGTIKRFGYKGSKFLTSVVNDQMMLDLSESISEALGKTVAVSVAVAFNPQYNKF